jgi:hypothetical protein
MKLERNSLVVAVVDVVLARIAGAVFDELPNV